MPLVSMTRATIDHTALKNVQVAVMDFPYTTALDAFKAEMVRLGSKEKLEYREDLPFEQLNSALVAIAPSLVHGFVTYNDKLRMVALARITPNKPLWRPETSRVNDLVVVWVQRWAESTFKTEIASRQGKYALSTLLQAIQHNNQGWAIIEASSLWQQVNAANTITYQALPSVLAALFVETSRSQSAPFTMGEIEKPVEWRLSQSGRNALAVVSKPFEHRTKKGSSDLISYKLEFRLQTQPGRDEPWLLIHIRLQRWATRMVKQPNFKRDVSVMLTLGSERHEEWPIHTHPIMTRLAVARRNKNYAWSNDVAALLEAWGMRELVDPNKLFVNPEAYHPAADQDDYLILHAEGMTYEKGRHSAKSGTSLRERAEIIGYFEETMQPYLSLDKPLLVDDLASLTGDAIVENQIMPLYTHNNMKKIAVPSEPGKKIDAVRRTAAQEITAKAMLAARGNKPLHVLIITKEDKPDLERVVREVFFLEPDDPLPEYLTIKPVRMSVDLDEPPGRDIPNRYERKFTDRSKHQNTLDVEWNAKCRAWEEFLKQHIDPKAHNLALIELSGKQQDLENDDERYAWRKSAIRHACVNLGVVSQALLTVPAGIYSLPRVRTELPRVRNAVHDLLLRQTHLLYGLPPDLYRYAGVSEERSQALVIGCLYRLRRTSANPSIDFPIYLELHPDGRVMVIWPDSNGGLTTPVPYLEASVALGKMFSVPATRANDYIFNYHHSKQGTRLASFVEGILKYANKRPTLLLMEADGWRQEGIFLTANGKMSLDTLKVGQKTYSTSDLFNLRLLRVRDAGSLGETPQYMGRDIEGLEVYEQNESMLGVIDKRTSSDFLYYFSIGRQPQTTADQDDTAFAFEEGGDIAFRHQQAIELIPFFGVQRDERLAFCRIAHLLRSTPAWKGGSIILPYPLHLAQKLVDDALDVLRPRI